MTTRTVPLLAAAALLAASTTAVAASPPPPGAQNTKKCGDVATKNGGQARYIRASKTPCATAKTIASKANGKSYRASGFACNYVSGIYLCTKSGKRSVVFQYKKPKR